MFHPISPQLNPLHFEFLLFIVAFHFLQIILLGHNMPLYRLRRRRRSTRLRGHLLFIPIGFFIYFVFLLIIFTRSSGAVFAA